jgi:hypothetical protein
VSQCSSRVDFHPAIAAGSIRIVRARIRLLLTSEHLSAIAYMVSGAVSSADGGRWAMTGGL